MTWMAPLLGSDPTPCPTVASPSRFLPLEMDAIMLSSSATTQRLPSQDWCHREALCWPNLLSLSAAIILPSSPGEPSLQTHSSVSLAIRASSVVQGPLDSQILEGLLAPSRVAGLLVHYAPQGPLLPSTEQLLALRACLGRQPLPVLVQHHAWAVQVS